MRNNEVGASVADRMPASGRSRVVIAVFSVITVGYLVWLVSSNFHQIDRALVRLRSAAVGWLIAAMLLEAFSQMCGVVVQHRLLKRAGAAVGFRTSARLVLAQNAIGSVVPGGTAAASMFSYRQIRRHGADGSAAAWVVATSSLVGMLALATFGMFTATGTSLLSVFVATGLIGALVVLVLLIRAPQLLVDPTTSIAMAVRRLRRRPHDRATVRAQIEDRLSQLSAVKLSRNDWLVVAIVALAAVAADCGVWVCISHTMITLPARCLQRGRAPNALAQCAKFRTPTLSALFVAYSAGQAAQSVPFLPAGIGLVESAMTATLTAAKARAIPALAAVLLYRIVSVWGVIAIAGLIWAVSQRLARSRQLLK